MSRSSRASKGPYAVGVSTSRRRHLLRIGISAVVLSGIFGVLGAATLAQASTISAKAFCDKISVSTVSSLFGQKIPLLDAWNPTPGNDACEFAKIVNGLTSGLTMSYDYKGTGTPSSNIAELKKEKGVSDLVFKSYASIGGTTYSFTDTFSITTLHTKINESGMVSYNGSNHYAVILTKVLPTSTLAKLLNLAVRAA